MTDLDSNGDYPIGDEFITTQTEQFDEMWKSYFSMIPPLDNMDKSYRERMKDFAFKIFQESYFEVDIQKLANIAYKDGIQDGIQTAKQDIQEKMVEILNDIN
jgi:hypothetical protein